MNVRTSIAYIAIASCIAAGCTRAPDDATPTPQPRTSTPIQISMASGVATPGPRSLPFPRPTASPTARPTHTPPIPTSPLYVDGPAGRIYASGPMSGTAQLAVYDTGDGRLVATAPLAIDERLLDIDHDAGWLYVYRPSFGVRLLDAGALTETGRVGLPTPDAADNVAESYFPWAPWPVPPILHPVTHHILTVAGTRIRVHDASTGAEVEGIDLPFERGEGPIIRASLSADGRLLYAAAADPKLGAMDSSYGAIILAFDMDARRLIERRRWRGPITCWLAWDRSLLVESELYKDIGARQGLWVDGHERRRIVGAEARWRVADTRRGRLIGTDASHGGERSWLATADLMTLDAMSFVQAKADLALNGWLAPLFMGYDVVSDRAFAYSEQSDRLHVIPVSELRPDAPNPDVATKRQVAYVSGSIPAAAGSTGEPVAYTGEVFGTPGAGTPTPDWGDGTERVPVIRRAGDRQWSTNRPVGLPEWPYSVVAAPSAGGGKAAAMLFGLLPGLGVFRSTDAGRSWHPSSAGIDALYVREIHVSPDYVRDRTLIAASFTTAAYSSDAYWFEENPTQPFASTVDDDPAASAWRSRDGGEHWAPIGRLVAFAFSPEFAHDRTVGALAHLGSRFYLSTDGGDRWQARGRLDAAQDTLFAGTTWVIPATDRTSRTWLVMATTHSEIGGGLHWPESGPRLYRSTDDGTTWVLAWRGDADSDAQGAVANGDVPLMGVAGIWVLACVASISTETGWDDATLLSRDGGLTWREQRVTDDAGACPVAALPDGRIVIEGETAGEPLTIELDALDPVSQDTPPRP